MIQDTGGSGSMMYPTDCCCSSQFHRSICVGGMAAIEPALDVKWIGSVELMHRPFVSVGVVGDGPPSAPPAPELQEDAMGRNASTAVWNETGSRVRLLRRCMGSPKGEEGTPGPSRGALGLAKWNRHRRIAGPRGITRRSSLARPAKRSISGCCPDTGPAQSPPLAQAAGRDLRDRLRMRAERTRSRTGVGRGELVGAAPFERSRKTGPEGRRPGAGRPPAAGLEASLPEEVAFPRETAWW